MLYEVITGLSLYMESLKNEDINLFNVVEPQFNKIIKKRNIAIGTLISSLALTTTLYTIGITTAMNSVDIYGEPDINKSFQGIFLVGGGTCVFMGGLAAYLLLSYNFV